GAARAVEHEGRRQVVRIARIDVHRHAADELVRARAALDQRAAGAAAAAADAQRDRLADTERAARAQLGREPAQSGQARAELHAVALRGTLEVAVADHARADRVEIAVAVHVGEGARAEELARRGPGGGRVLQDDRRGEVGEVLRAERSGDDLFDSVRIEV